MVHCALIFQHTCRVSAVLKSNISKHKRTVFPRTRPSGIRSASSRQQPPSSSRRAVTVTSDDGRYEWSELTTTEKAARTTQQSFNFLLVAAGAVGTVRASYPYKINPADPFPGHRLLFPIHRALRGRLQNTPIQPRGGSCQDRPSLP